MTRRVATFTAIGAVAAFFAGVHPRLSAIGDRAAAQTSDTALVSVTSLPNTSGNDDDPWHHFELTIPPASHPLDVHIALLIDGKGDETVIEEPHAWSQPLPFKYRLDNDDDSRVKGILEAQGFSVKKNLITYRFAAGTYGTVDYNQTIRFRHKPSNELDIINKNTQAAVGEKIVLENRLLCDTDFKGNPDKLAGWKEVGYVPKLPPGIVHHLVVYVMVQPHQGPPVTEGHSITHKI